MRDTFPVSYTHLVVKRIAVVEDEVYMREELCNMLQKDGYLAEAITEFEEMCIRDRYKLFPHFQMVFCQ